MPDNECLSEDMPSTPYLPLSHTAKEIRVLHLNTRNLDSSGRITCSLRTVSLLQNPVFEAISWCWGDTLLTREVVINGHPFEISATAEAVLRTLCFKNRHAIVWLDAVCINQEDLAERACQVSLMREVYSSAHRVLVWLGGDLEGFGEDAFRSIDILHAQCQQKVATGSQTLEELFWNQDGQLLRSFRPLPDCNWQSLVKLYAAAWFSRLWVVQEVMLNGNALCYYGEAHRSWEEISLAAQWLWYRRYDRPLYCGRQVAGIKTTSQKWCYARRGYDITALLHMSAGLRVTVPYDKVYGMLGLLGKSNATFPVDFVNYEMKLSSAFAIATRAALLERQDSPNQLEALRYAGVLISPPGSTGDEGEWPSWVPRYDGKYSRSSGSPSLADAGLMPGAANGLSASMKADSSPLSTTTLALQGILFDDVRECGSIMTLDLIHRNYERYSAERRSWADMACVSEETLHIVLSGGYANNRAKQGEQSERSKEAGIVWQQSANRRFFVTNGNHIGTGPPNMKAGDVIWILLGGKTPFVLGREQEHWVMLGACYVYGIMRGEYVQKLQGTGQFEKAKEWIEIH